MARKILILLSSLGGEDTVLGVLDNGGGDDDVFHIVSDVDYKVTRYTEKL